MGFPEKGNEHRTTPIPGPIPTTVAGFRQSGRLVFDEAATVTGPRVGTELLELDHPTPGLVPRLRCPIPSGSIRTARGWSLQ